jgi:SAM-dependent methyltransferase
MFWKSYRDNLDTPGFYKAMHSWYQTPLGERLLQSESALLEHCLPRRFGYHLLQIGCADVSMFKSSPIGHKFSITHDRGEQPGTSGIVARGEAIPLTSESVDMVLLHHALDYSSYQHQLLREVSRVLIAGGHVVILGFNPISSWGIRTRFPGRKKSPWHGRLLSTLRVTDWLKLLDFQVEQVRYGAYSLPINSPGVIRYSGLLDKLASRLNWPTGGIYMISARKQVLPLTPIQTSWREFTNTHVGLPIAENITRVSRDMAASNEEF